MSGNGYKTAQRWIDDYERHEGECQRIMVEAAAKCQPFKTLMSKVVSSAKEDGIPTKVFRVALLERKHLRNAANAKNKLDDEELLAELEEMRRALSPVNDLPLFGAAIASTEAKISDRAKKRSAAVDSLTDGPASTVASNVVALEAGIKPLH